MKTLPYIMIQTYKLPTTIIQVILKTYGEIQEYFMSLKVKYKFA